MKISLASILTLFGAGLCLAQQPAPVATEFGLVQGVAEKDLTVYRGIPFAAHCIRSCGRCFARAPGAR